VSSFLFLAVLEENENTIERRVILRVR